MRPRFSGISWRRFLTNKYGAITLGALLPALCCLSLIKFSVGYLETYGGVLFIGLPIFSGFSSVFLYTIRKPKSWGKCVGVLTLSLLLLAGLVMVCAIDGAICLIMAFPLAFILALFGGWVGYETANSWRHKRNTTLPVWLLFFLIPPLMGFEKKLGLEPPLRRVVTSVDIAASPDTIWQYVIAFPPIPEPTETIFKAGIAYPKNAVIKGRGAGAVRHCNFTTGAFVEPITVWQPPRLLKFDVTKNPPPMKEWSFYADLEPTHFHNFMVSKAGQFRIIPINATTTRLEGTTWYYHRLWPNFYWGIISDDIIHTIHRRVLNHVKNEAERHTRRSASQN